MMTGKKENCFDLNRTAHFSPACAGFLMSVALSACLCCMKAHDSHALFLTQSPCVAAPEAIYDVHENHPVKWSGQAGGGARLRALNSIFMAGFPHVLSCNRIHEYHYIKRPLWWR